MCWGRVPLFRETPVPYETSPNTLYPYSAVGAVVGDTYYGTGVLIGTNVVLTAAHLLDSNRLGFIPGVSGTSAPYGSALSVSKVSGASFDGSGLLTRAQSANDWGVLAFSTNFSARGTGYVPVSAGYNSGTVRIVGYPAGYGQRQQRLDGPVSRDPTGSVLNFDGFQIVPGNSGGPLLAGGDGSPSVVGIVSTVLWANLLTPAEVSRINDAVAVAAQYVTPATSQYNITAVAGEYQVRDQRTGTLAAAVQTSAQHVQLAVGDYTFNDSALRARGLDPGLLRDFDGNDLGGAGGWRVIGAATLSLAGGLDYILVNPGLGRWAEARPTASGGFNLGNYGANGDTRVVGIYRDPLIDLGIVQAGSDFDSQRRFTDDVQNDRLQVLGGADYDKNGVVDFFMKIKDGNGDQGDDVYLRAIMHADRNIQYANYMNVAQFTSYMQGNNVAAGVYSDWLRV